MIDAETERERLKTEWPAEFADGVEQGKERFTKYPRGLLTEWSDDRRNAWWAGFNVAYMQKKKGLKGVAR
jgi:hypothetical protein